MKRPIPDHTLSRDSEEILIALCRRIRDNPYVISSLALDELKRAADKCVSVRYVNKSPIPSDAWEAIPESVKAWIHDLASEADPAGTLRELRLAQDTIKAQEKLIDELKLELARVNDQLEFERDLQG